MATEVRWRRGTTAENDNFTGAEGEITVDIDQKTIRVHDNATQGGHPSLTEEAAHEAGYAYQVDSVSDLQSGSFPTSLKRIWLAGFYEPNDGGGGMLLWDENEDKANHNGGTIIDPDHTATPGDEAWYIDENTGDGCWKRSFNEIIYPEWFGVRVGEEVTNSTVDIINTVANGNKIIWPDGEILFSSGTIYFGNEVNWVSAGHTTFKFNAESFSGEDWFRPNNSVYLKNITFDANNNCAKILDIRPPFTGIVLIEDCTFKNALQPADEDGTSPTTGSANGIMVRGRFQKLSVFRSTFRDIKGDSDGSVERPVVRGIDYSETGAHSNDGAPIISVVDSCIFDTIITPNTAWATQETDADGIVWRNQFYTQEALLTIKNSYFTDCQKRFIKANIGSNIRVINNHFVTSTDKPLINVVTLQGGDSTYSNCIFKGNTIYFPDDTCFADSPVTIWGPNVKVLNNSFIIPSGSPEHIIAFRAGDQFKGLGNIIKGNYIEAPDGIDYLIRSRLNAMESSEAAKAVGVHDCIVSDNHISKINTAFVSVDRSGTGYTYQSFWTDDRNIIDEGITDTRTYVEDITNLTTIFKPGSYTKVEEFGSSIIQEDLYAPSGSTPGTRLIKRIISIREYVSGDEAASYDFTLDSISNVRVSVRYSLIKSTTDEALYHEALFMGNNSDYIEKVTLLSGRTSKTASGEISATTSEDVLTIDKTSGTSSAGGTLTIILDGIRYSYTS